MTTGQTLESPHIWKYAARYLPELDWPPRVVKEAAERRTKAMLQKEKNKRTHDAAPGNLTPRPSRMLRSGPRTTGTNLVAGSYRNENLDNERKLEPAVSGACSLDHLMHVEYLRDLADRVLRQEYRKREEERITSGADLDERQRRRAGKTEFKRERKKKMTRLFMEAIRLKMRDEGSLVEVVLTPVDMDEQILERSTRRREFVGGDSSEKGWDGSFNTHDESILSDKSARSNNISRWVDASGTVCSRQTSSSQKMLLAQRMFPRPSGMTIPEGFLSDPEDDVSSPNVKLDPVGYVFLSAQVIGIAILHVLHLEAWQRSREYLPHGDPRRDNGLNLADITKRITGLHERWERITADVVEAGIEELVASSELERFGQGWKPTASRS
jgi:hypothetical protein